MANKETTIEEKLKNLYSLQVIDNQLKEIAILRGELPEEVKDLENEIIGLETRAAKTQEQLDVLLSEKSKHEANISESEAHIIKYNKQLENVKNNREFTALTKEIEMQNLEIQLSQKKIRESNGKITVKEETLAGTNEKITTMKEALTLKNVELEQIIVKTEKQEKSLLKKSTTARKAIEDRVLKAYDKIRGAYKNSLAVVTVSRDACGGCFNKIPPQLQLEIRMRKKIIACEHCGRVLVDNETAGIKEEVDA